MQRLKKHMNDIVSQHQSAFVGGRLIQDNILITHEVFHDLRRSVGRNKDSFIAKIDMNKAYDRIEWGFMEKCLLAYGFNQNWVNLVMNCVRGVTYRYKINGIPSQKVKPSRGLRQGDPLSPYLFILAMDALSYMLNQAKENGRLQGIKLTTSSPVLTHLFFADDVVLFCNARVEEAYELKRILNVFSRASVQRVNLHKSGLIFGKKVPHNLKS